MGESAVLAHSYSFAAPITRNEPHEDNTLHALSQSVSFGKFVTENLEWGKWSSFSHKKYVEEAEKYSRPGSVAQKKAFFEAHYKRIAEAKKAATQEEPTVTPAEVLLHALETQPPPPLNTQPPDEEQPQRKSIQIDSLEEKDKEDGLIVNYNGEDKEKKHGEERRSITKNRPVFRLSLEKTIPPKSLDTATEIALSEKTSERPPIEKKEEKPVHRQRFSFFGCFMGNAKTQDQSREKRETEKKKQFLCLCLKPKSVRE